MATLNDSIRFRTNQKKKDRFIEKCESVNRPYQEMLREMMDAFAEGRLRITPSEAHKEIYHDN